MFKTYFWYFLILMAGMGILFVSLSRASLEIITKESREDTLRKYPITFTIKITNSTQTTHTYKLPFNDVEKNNFFSLIKSWRDNLWIKFTRDNINKSKIALLVADKKMAQAISLIKVNDSKMALEASQEALEKLKYADSLVNNANQNNGEVKQIRSQIYEAGYAYREILKGMENLVNINKNDQYLTIIKNLDNWNENQEKEKEVGNF